MSGGIRAGHVNRSLSSVVVALGVASLLTLTPDRAFAASSAACAGGGFSLLGLSGNQRGIVAADNLGNSFLGKSTYIQVTLGSQTVGVRDWTFWGAPEPPGLTRGTPARGFARTNPHP